MKYIVYHGGGFGKEYFWFSSSKDVAASYGDMRVIDTENNMPILDDFKAYEINIQNPYIIDAKEEYYFDIPTPQEMIDDNFWHSETVDTDGICDYAKMKGYDSIIIKNVVEGHGVYHIADDYVCFNKAQFKELYNNKVEVEKRQKELYEIVKTYGKNLRDDKWITHDVFELSLENPVKIKYKEYMNFYREISYFRINGNDGLQIGRKDYLYSIDEIDKYEKVQMLIDAVKKESKQLAKVENIYQRINLKLQSYLD